MRNKINKPLNLIILIAVFGLLFLPFNVTSEAEEVDAEFETVENVEEPSDEDEKEVSDIMDEFLEKKGWNQGPNKNSKGSEFFVVTGSQEILLPYKHKNFISSRQNAFTQAMAKAKRAMVEHLETEIETSMQMEMVEPSEKREEIRLAEIKSEVIAIEELRKTAGAAKNDLQKKADEFGSEMVKQAASGADRLYRDKLEKELRAKGIDPDKGVDEQLLKKELQVSFQESTKALAQSRLSGIQAYATFEHLPANKDKGEIGVIAIWSKKLHAMALAVTQGGVLIPPGTPKTSIKNQIPKNKKALLMTFGVQMKTDENGNLNLVSFCQTGQRNKRAKASALRQAQLCSQKQIRTYAGEMLYSASQNEEAESMEVLEGGMEIYENDKSFEDTIKTESAKLKISGMSKIKTWHTKHPITKQQIRGAVYAWSPGSSNVAKRMKSSVTSDEIPAEFSEAAQKQKNSKGTTANKSRSQPKPSEPRQTLSGAGTSGSDDF
jgi:cell division septation protein DedD